MMVRRWRWKSPRRTLLLLVAVLLLCGLLIRLPAQHVGAQAPTHYLTVTVRPGDTLWGIATLHLPEDDDVRRFVDVVSSTNGLRGGPITPGQRLQIPVYGGP